jgi:predicted transport protein
MSSIKLFRTTSQQVEELTAKSIALEKSLQAIFEENLEIFLGVRFLATEYSTGENHRGRIDTLGLDENNCPVIIEYKRASNENIINQGLFYLNWLLDHKAEFELLVQKKISMQAADNIEWASPRVLCIAGDFTRYDEHAVHEIGKNIELIRYRRYGEEFLLLEAVNTVWEISQSITQQCDKEVISSHENIHPTNHIKSKGLSFADRLAKSSASIQSLYQSLRDFMLSLGDDVQEKELHLYTAFKRMKNFACISPNPSRGVLFIWVKIDPHSITLEKDFTRAVDTVGHWGTGDLEITIKNGDDLKKAEPLILKSYEAN